MTARLKWLGWDLRPRGREQARVHASVTHCHLQGGRFGNDAQIQYSHVQNGMISCCTIQRQERICQVWLMYNICRRAQQVAMRQDIVAKRE